jgi:hypothetical protein
MHQRQWPLEIRQFERDTGHTLPSGRAQREDWTARRTEKGAKRSDRNDGQFVKQASFTRSVKGPEPAFPRARERAVAVTAAGSAGLAVLREGWRPVRGETLGL